MSSMLRKAIRTNMNRGLCNDLFEGVINLQYVDDAILFVDKDVKYEKNLKWILTYSKLMSDMRINYHKSELIPINIQDLEEVKHCASIFGCPKVAFPIKYLGAHIHFHTLK
jgi:hypothetical protein